MMNLFNIQMDYSLGIYEYIKQPTGLFHHDCGLPEGKTSGVKQDLSYFCLYVHIIRLIEKALQPVLCMPKIYDHFSLVSVFLILSFTALPSLYRSFHSKRLRHPKYIGNFILDTLNLTLCHVTHSQIGSLNITKQCSLILTR